MKYLLVLQWPASSIKDYDTMIEMEEALMEKMSEESEVDGHDAGSGEMNIFIYTNNPQKAFNEVKSILSAGDLWGDARVAYREISGEKFTILWPKDLTDFQVT